MTRPASFEADRLRLFRLVGDRGRIGKSPGSRVNKLPSSRIDTFPERVSCKVEHRVSVAEALRGAYTMRVHDEIDRETNQSVAKPTGFASYDEQRVRTEYLASTGCLDIVRAASRCSRATGNLVPVPSPHIVLRLPSFSLTLLSRRPHNFFHSPRTLRQPTVSSTFFSISPFANFAIFSQSPGPRPTLTARLVPPFSSTPLSPTLQFFPSRQDPKSLLPAEQDHPAQAINIQRHLMTLRRPCETSENRRKSRLRLRF